MHNITVFKYLFFMHKLPDCYLKSIMFYLSILGQIIIRNI